MQEPAEDKGFEVLRDVHIEHLAGSENKGLVGILSHRSARNDAPEVEHMD